MVKKLLVFDMDGTIADLYGVDGWLAFLREENTLPYEKAVPMYNMEEMRKTLLKLKKCGYLIAVTTWLSKESSQDFKREVRKAKREWLEKYFPSCGKEIHLVQYGTPKYCVTNPKGANSGLVRTGGPGTGREI